MLEGLESRLLLFATNGGSWAFPARITYSFAPDGTSIGGVSSSWFQTMSNDGFSTANWEQQFQKAAQVWQSVANINLVQVSDNGEAFGTTGNQQGDSRFGDIRIGGTPLSSGLALTFLPPPKNGGTLAGDIVMNTTSSWHVNSDYDIETVAIHELGHALGMDHSSISTAVMYAYYTGMKQSLTTDDIQGIDSIYGAVPADPTNNSCYSNALNITSNLNSLNQTVLSGLSLTGSGDYDWYYVVAPTSGTLSVTMQSSGLSSLSPKVILYNSSVVGLTCAQAPNSYGATVTASYSVTAGQGYYIKAMAANAGTNGAYALLINFGGPSMPSVAPPNTVVVQQPDQGGGSEAISKPSVSPNHHGHNSHHHHQSIRLGFQDQVGPVKLGTLLGQGDFLSVRTHVSAIHPRASVAHHPVKFATRLG
jgi:hypothetical protein